MKDNIKIKEITRLVEKASTDFEKNNNELKRKYLLWNITAYNLIASKVDSKVATFGTGYPFYALDSNLNGKLPIITEQIRYNRQLIKDNTQVQDSEFRCKSCLDRNYKKMKDLKTICKPCPNMPNSIKPRKIINRLPDLDLWLICEDGKVAETEKQFKNLLEENNMLPSDVDPMTSIEKACEISELLRKGKLPPKYMFLPIDTHIVEYSNISELIDEVPNELKWAEENKEVPYIPIYPFSLRKEWQHDDTAYNFIYDFLSAFTPFNFPDELSNKLNKSRKEVANMYTDAELYSFLIKSATDANARRFKTPELRKIFKDKMNLWKEITIDDENNKGPNLE